MKIIASFRIRDKKEEGRKRAEQGGVRRPLAAIALSHPKGGPREDAGGLMPAKDDNAALRALYP